MSGSVSSVLLTDEKEIQWTPFTLLHSSVCGCARREETSIIWAPANRVTTILVFVSPTCKDLRDLAMKVVTDTSFQNRAYAPFQRCHCSCSGMHFQSIPGHISQAEELWGLPLEHSTSVQTYTNRSPSYKTQNIAPKSSNAMVISSYPSLARTSTELDGTVCPSFSSNPGAQALRQAVDHILSWICSKFIPEPMRQHH